MGGDLSVRWRTEALTLGARCGNCVCRQEWSTASDRGRVHCDCCLRIDHRNRAVSAGTSTAEQRRLRSRLLSQQRRPLQCRLRHRRTRQRTRRRTRPQTRLRARRTTSAARYRTHGTTTSAGAAQSVVHRPISATSSTASRPSGNRPKGMSRNATMGLTRTRLAAADRARTTMATCAPFTLDVGTLALCRRRFDRSAVPNTA